MAKKELKEQLKRLLKLNNRESHFDNTGACKECCWYYDSKFEV